MIVQSRLLFIKVLISLPAAKALPLRYIHTPSSSETESGWVVQAGLEFVILRPQSPEWLGLQAAAAGPVTVTPSHTFLSAPSGFRNLICISATAV